MKKIIFASVTILALAFASCKKTETVTVDSSKPSGTFTVNKTGTLTAQNGTPTAGTVELGTDAAGTRFVHLMPNFTTMLATGTATIYLSKTMTFTASPGTGNPDLKLAGVVAANGEAWYKLSGTVAANLEYLIVWCGTAGIPFGNARLQ
jgi:hypothetical protein